MRRDWIKVLRFTLKLGDVHTVEESKSLHGVLAKHATVFEEKLGCLKGSGKAEC